MNLDENLASVHAYLCADGYVIKNPENSKYKYFHIGFRNTNLILLKDFQDKFEKVFRIKPYLIEGQRCRVGSKEIYEKLNNQFGSFYSWTWKMPKMDKNLSKIWLRSYFDCEGWVFCKTHQNRHIGLDCVNRRGVIKIIDELKKFGIKTIKKYNQKRKIYRIIIYRKENLDMFSKQIGFLHSEKSNKLKQALNDFVVYKWDFPKDKTECKKFIIKILKEKLKVKKPYYARITSKEESNLKKLKELLYGFYEINSLLYKRKNGLGTIYFELNINKKACVKKLIDLDIIPNIFKEETVKLKNGI